MSNGKFNILFKKLKSTKYKTRDKITPLKMNELQPDESICLSYDETSFLSYRKVPKV